MGYKSIFKKLYLLRNRKWVERRLKEIDNMRIINFKVNRSVYNCERLWIESYEYFLDNFYTRNQNKVNLNKFNLQNSREVKLTMSGEQTKGKTFHWNMHLYKNIIIGILVIGFSLFLTAYCTMIKDNLDLKSQINDLETRLKGYLGKELDLKQIDQYVDWIDNMLEKYTLSKYLIKEELRDYITYPVEDPDDCFIVNGGEYGERVLTNHKFFKGKMFHQGTDTVKAKSGKVISPFLIDCEVYKTGYDEYGGYYVELTAKILSRDIRIALLHLSSVNVVNGQTVSPGQKLGMVGGTGKGADGIVHLCFAMYEQGEKGKWFCVNMFENSKHRPWEDRKVEVYDFLVD